MAARASRWWGRAVVVLALLAIALFYAAGAAVFWADAEHVAFAIPAANLIVALAELGWALPDAARVL
ncbi:hypothetical protein [Phenylobacterium sp.]|uniref:hypothetical protein n=1 Tax=Phenylobacterium sp. TaxID=1871053 RepID=UPI00286AA3CB|nr:hypothetical protein [Phenylobacterium sp.]